MSFKTSYFLLVVGFAVDVLIVSGVTLPPAVIAQPSAEADQLQAAVGQLSQRLESLNTQLAQQASFCNAEIAALRTRTGIICLFVCLKLKKGVLQEEIYIYIYGS